MELLFFAQEDVLAGRFEVVRRPEILGISFAEPHAFLVLCATVFSLVMLGLVALRRSRFGRRLVALRDSSAAYTTVGLDVRKTKLGVFALSAVLGGVAGAILAMQRGTPTAPDFGMFPGLSLVMFLVMGGITLIGGALFAGWANFLFSWVTTTWTGTFVTVLNRVGPGAIAAAVSVNPNGVAGEMARDLPKLLPWRHDARAAGRAAARARRGPDPKLLGIEEPFTELELRRIDDRLGIPAKLRGEI
jgi:ABC-type branched-subunit amino acid transport system permease subunit